MTAAAEAPTIAAAPDASLQERPPTATRTAELRALFVSAFPDLFDEDGPSSRSEGDGDAGAGADAGSDAAKSEDGGSPGKASPAEQSPDKASQDGDGAEGEGGGEEGEGGEGAGAEAAAASEPDEFDLKLEDIRTTFEQSVSRANDVEDHLLSSQRQADEAESRALSEADALYTPHWRDTGLPEMPSFLRLDGQTLESAGLFDPLDLWGRAVADRDAKSAAPKTIEYFDTGAKGYLKITNNVKVRSAILEQYPKRTHRTNLHGLTDAELLAKAKESERRLKELSMKMSAAQWDEEVKILKRMEQKLNYARNPRHLAGPAKAGKASGAPRAVEDFFMIEPGTIEFQDYELGGMYSMQVRIRNKSSLSRHARLLPPRSQYFSISNIEYPGSQNLLAPGMCCKCDLYFMPDSLADYDDFFSVETDVKVFQVQIAARRPIPNLTVSQAFDCGPCLLGHTLTTDFPCTNKGGRGAFYVVPEEDWPHKAAPSESPVINLEPFNFEPAKFKLFPQDSTTFKINFLPTKSGDFARNFKMVCDNCRVLTFTITGQGVKLDVKLTAVDGKASSVEEEDVDGLESDDNDKVSSPNYRRMWFGEVVPGANHSRTVTIRNNTPIPLAFNWMLNASNNGGASADGQNTFTILPMSGVLGAHENSEFILNFLPNDIESYISNAALMINSHGSKEGTMLRKVVVLYLKGRGRAKEVTLHPPYVDFSGKMLLGKQYTRDVTLTNHSEAPASFVWENVPDTMTIFPRESKIPAGESIECDLTIHASTIGKTDMTVVNVFEHGPRLPLRIMCNVVGPKVKILSPHIDFGLVQVMTEAAQSFEIENCSDTKAAFAFTNQKSNKAPWKMRFSIDEGVLDPHEKRRITLYCTPESRQALRSVVACTISAEGMVCAEHKVSVRADVISPLACLSTTKLDVGVSYMNVAVERTVKIHNLTKLPSHYNWLSHELLSENAEDPASMQVLVTPQKGTINPGMSEEFDIEITPCAIGNRKVIIPCEIDGMEETLGLEITTSIENISVQYELCFPEADDVAGAPEPKQFAMAEDFSINLGNLVKIGKRCNASLRVKNRSAIRANVQVMFDKFGVPADLMESTINSYMNTQLEGNMSEIILQSPMRQNVGLSIELISKLKASAKAAVRRKKTLMAKTLTDAKRLESALLSKQVVTKLTRNMEEEKDETIIKAAGNFGIAFFAEPSEAILQPWSEVEFQIICVNNMCGRYFDKLFCDINGLPMKCIPIRAGIVGTPLSVRSDSLKRHSENRVLDVNWGELCKNTCPETKKFWVSNTGPFDVQVDWSVGLLNGDDDDGKALATVDIVGRADGSAKVKVEAKGKTLHGEWPFKLSTPRQIIAAGSTEEVSVQFAAQVPDTWKAIVRGTQSIQANPSDIQAHHKEGSGSDDEESGENLVGTFHPYAAPPYLPLETLRINLMAETMEPHLDADGMEKLKFVCHACTPGTDPSYSKCVTFTNTNNTTVAFSLQTEGAYSITAMRPSCKQILPEALSEMDISDVYVLPSRENIEVSLEFLKPKLSTESERSDRVIGGSVQIQFLPPKGFDMLEQRDTVLNKQTFPLTTLYMYPHLTLSNYDLDFGNVHPNAPKTLELVITNPTLVSASWSIVEDKAPPPLKNTLGSRRRSSVKTSAVTAKEAETFKVSSTKGKIPGRGIGQPQKEKILVTFLPLAAKHYTTKYIVKVQSGRYASFTVRGSGSYDEVLESDLALVLS